MEENNIFLWSYKICTSSSIFLVVFYTDTDSPVRGASSTIKDMDFNSTILKSAGTLSPILTSTMSPGTKLLESEIAHSPSLSNLHSTAYISLRASSAWSALESCQIAITALATRINRITNGSTYAVSPSSPSPI